MQRDARLPSGFEALEPFVSPWAVDGTARRAALRDAATADELKSFFEATSPLLDAALDYLDTRPLGAHGTDDQRLMNLLLAFAHVSIAVELQGPDEQKHTALRRSMRIVRSPADGDSRPSA